MEPLVTRLVAAVIQLASIGLACWHLRVRRTHRRGELAPAEYDFYRRQFASILRFSSVVGTTPWVLYDFQSPMRQNRYQRGYNRKGLIADDHHTRKLAFGAVREIYADMP